jgi:hypothetical protein
MTQLETRLLVISFAPLLRLQHWISYFRRKFLSSAWGSCTPEHGIDSASANYLSPEAKSPFVRTQFLADPARQAYHAYGLGRLAPWAAGGPHILTQYVHWLFQGRPVRWTTEDLLQRGGDFVVGRDGRLTFCHVGRDQSETASANAILAALHSISDKAD